MYPNSILPFPHEKSRLFGVCHGLWFFRLMAVRCKNRNGWHVGMPMPASFGLRHRSDAPQALFPHAPDSQATEPAAIIDAREDARDKELSIGGSGSATSR